MPHWDRAKTLNKIVRWVKPPGGSGRERVEYEIDPRHDMTIHQLGLGCSRSESTPSESQNLELITAQCPTKLTTICIDLQRCGCVILLWIVRTCSYHQKSRDAGCEHQQLETWRGSNKSRHLIGHGRLIQASATNRGTASCCDVH